MIAVVGYFSGTLAIIVYFLNLPSSLFNQYPFSLSTAKLLGDFCTNKRCAEQVHLPHMYNAPIFWVTESPCANRQCAPKMEKNPQNIISEL
jgi:hypothetical protein